jgi:hypothetical protein
VISAATGVLLVLAVIFFATVVVGAPPAATQPATTQASVDRAHLLGRWTATYPVAGKDRTLTYTFKDDGSFEEYESNWGRNWGDWRLDGDALHMHWRGRRGFNGTMRVLTLTTRSGPPAIPKPRPAPSRGRPSRRPNPAAPGGHSIGYDPGNDRREASAVKPDVDRTARSQARPRPRPA